jgi:hypothetical protein
LTTRIECSRTLRQVTPPGITNLFSSFTYSSSGSLASAPATRGSNVFSLRHREHPSTKAESCRRHA